MGKMIWMLAFVVFGIVISKASAEEITPKKAPIIIPCQEETLDLDKAAKACEDHCVIVAAWKSDGKTFDCVCQRINLGTTPRILPAPDDSRGVIDVAR